MKNQIIVEEYSRTTTGHIEIWSRKNGKPHYSIHNPEDIAAYLWTAGVNIICAGGSLDDYFAAGATEGITEEGYCAELSRYLYSLEPKPRSKARPGGFSASEEAMFHFYQSFGELDTQSCPDFMTTATWNRYQQWLLIQTDPGSEIPLNNQSNAA